MTLIDAKYIGHALRHARRSISCSNADAAHLLNMTERQLLLCECGATPLNQDQIRSLFALGLLMMRARQIQSEFNKLSAMTYGKKSD